MGVGWGGAALGWGAFGSLASGVPGSAAQTYACTLAKFGRDQQIGWHQAPASCITVAQLHACMVSR